MTRHGNKRRGPIAALALGAALLVLLLAQAAPAAAAGHWRLDSMSNTNAAPGGLIEFGLQASNVGDAPIPPSPGGNEENCTPGAPPPAEAAKCVRVTATFPPGLTPVAALPTLISSCSIGAHSISCATNSDQFATNPIGQPAERYIPVTFTAAVDPGASGTLTTVFEVSGGETPAATTVDPTNIAAGDPEFGIDAFDALAAADASEAPLEQAGAHPYSQSATFDLSRLSREPSQVIGATYPVEPLRDAVVDLPPGFIGNPAVAETCSAGDLSNSESITSIPLCSPESQVGVVLFEDANTGGRPHVDGPRPVYNIEPPPGVVARFGFTVVGTVVMLDAHLHQSPQGDYVVSVGAYHASEGLAVGGSTVEIWGTPSDPVHEFDRGCPGVQAPRWSGKACHNDLPRQPFLRMPTSCGATLPWSLHADSWARPGALIGKGRPDLSDPAWKSATIVSHQGPGYPYLPSEWGAPISLQGCGAEPFDPALSVQPTTNQADSPSGLDLELSMPQAGLDDPDAIAESDLKSASLKLPAGMSVNPSSADGLDACGPAQIGLASAPGAAPILFSGAPQQCPLASKIGDVEVQTPLLDHPLNGAVYLARQQDNPFQSLLAAYLVIEDPPSGIVIKLAGRIVSGPGGQLETVFDNNPQTPFSKLHVSLYGGSRAALKTPARCGAYTTTADLSPWSGGAAAHLQSSFQITQGPGGSPCPAGNFNPRLAAGTANPLAGAYSPFALRLTRDDGTQELGGLSMKLPKGLLANLKGIPYCPDATLAAISGDLGTGAAQLARPSCPAGSLLGTVTVGAGAGPTPFYSRVGKAYWAGPYKGAPVSLATVVPAVAGPFDLGSVVVRNGFHVDPATAEITAVSDPFPTELHGIPLDLRDVRVELDRPNYVLNPTSCDPMSFEADIASSSGQSAHRSERFQVGACDRLGFKPKLRLRLKGGTKRSEHPALTATLTMPQGGANIARASVALPHSEFLAQSHIKTICTRVQYAAGAGGGSQCPKGSVYGYARAYSPILDYYLRGPVYLRSSSHPLPDLVASLGGQIQIDVVGRIDSKNGGIRTTFQTVPDAPVSKFVLEMPGGRKGLLENSRDICKGVNRATAQFDAQNGKISDFRPELKGDCGGKGKSKGKGKGGYAR